MPRATLRVVARSSTRRSSARPSSATGGKRTRRSKRVRRRRAGRTNQPKRRKRTGMPGGRRSTARATTATRTTLNSYGYRPGRSALDAVSVARKRCWEFDWVVDLDIKSFFDSIPHDLIEKAVAHHTDLAWVQLYVGRWLRAPIERPDGTLLERTKGTRQGGVASPLLANLFLHYAFDAWMQRTFPSIPFERYADDAIVHCRSEKQARFVLDIIRARLAECGLEL